MLISERIYQYMEEKGISQKEFADRTGISQSTVSDWKRKGTNPSADKIMNICEVLDISPYELLSGTENGKMKDYKEMDYVVIDKKSKEWLGTNMERYLRPDTLFGTKFESYLNQNIVDNQQKQKTGSIDWNSV